jgi:hypothetical protein
VNDLRPKDLALLLLASGDLLPRKRARDQQADIAGLELKRRILDLLVVIDPEPVELERALVQIVAELGPPHGPTRAICASFRDDWESAALAPELVDWLLEQALQEGENQGPRTKNRRSSEG